MLVFGVFSALLRPILSLVSEIRYPGRLFLRDVIYVCMLHHYIYFIYSFCDVGMLGRDTSGPRRPQNIVEVQASDFG